MSTQSEVALELQDTLLRELNEDIHSAMEDASLSLAELATASGLPQTVLMGLASDFRAQYRITLPYLCKLCAALGLRPAVALLAPGDNIRIEPSR